MAEPVVHTCNSFPKIRPRRRPSLLAAWAAVLLAATLGVATAATDEAIPRIVNGVDTHDFPTTAALLYAGNAIITEDNARVQCSATLIGCSTVLTAAHCVNADPVASHYRVYLQHAGLFDVAQIVKHPSYLSATFPIADFAVLKLASPVFGIAPQPLNLQDPVSFIPAEGTIAGFGRTGGASSNDYGIKRVGTIETVSCPAIPGTTATNTEVICWTFTNPVGPAGEDSNTCNGDSGGPLFMDLGAGMVVAGSTSGGTSSNCLPTDVSFDANVYNYLAFIQSRLGADSTSVCGSIPAVGTAGVTVRGDAGELAPNNKTASFEVTVPAGLNVLRFTLNGEDNGSFDVDFYVKEGTGAGVSDFDCKGDGNSNFAACEFPFPASGTWSVFVDRVAGSGQFQVTTTMIGGTPPACGNDQTEYLEECDGTDSDACPGLCQGDCTCPAPICGNDVVESGEQCDGSSDAACPGLCGASGTPNACLCCGDGVCSAGETALDCAIDCGCGAIPLCNVLRAPAGCYCDPDCLTFGDCCPDACSVCGECDPNGQCGDGAVDPGEDCDDGGIASGDCCSVVCEYEASGSACAADGNPCTDDVCDGAGACGVDNTASCDDGEFCTLTDVCSAGQCMGSGTPCAVDETCNETDDLCVSACTPGDCNVSGSLDAGDPVCAVLCLIGQDPAGSDCACAADCNCVGGAEASDPVCTVLRLIDAFDPDTCQ